MIDISVVLANFNNPELISTCLQTIDKFLLRPGLEVVIVDNGSVSQELETLRSSRPHVVIKYLPVNMGFGYAINRGAELARGSNLLILNSDVEIIDFSLQSLMLEFASTTGHALWSPNLIDSDGTIQTPSLQALGIWRFWVQFSVIGEVVRYMDKKNRKIDARRMTKDEQVDYLFGTCLIVKKDDFVRISGFDQKYFLYFEDLDFCDRFRKVFGSNIWLKSNSQVVHRARGSSGGPNSMNWPYQKSKFIYARDTFGLIFAILLLIVDIPTLFTYLAILRVNNKFLKN